MPEITIKATITPDHKLHADVPDDFPVGEAEVVLRSANGADSAENDAAELERLFAEIDELDFPRRSAAEIDADIASERASWGE